MPEEFDHLKGIPNKGLKAIWANTTINLVCPPRSLPSAQGMRWICRGQTRHDGTVSLALMFPWIIPNGEIRAAQAAGNVSPSLPLDPLHILQKYSRNTPEILLDIPTLSRGPHLECLNLTPGASLLLKRHETPDPRVQDVRIGSKQTPGLHLGLTREIFQLERRLNWII